MRLSDSDKQDKHVRNGLTSLPVPEVKIKTINKLLNLVQYIHTIHGRDSTGQKGQCCENIADWMNFLFEWECLLQRRRQ